MIDKAALKSILEKPENEPFLSPEDTEGTGYVYLIAHNNEVQEDESWMKVDFFSLMARWYDLVCDGGWVREYMAPPGIAIG